ncbi:LysR substrate-binding domain-containing protein [Mycobacterium sp.]|uniref:LysR substrate-binding domain-containing protein n=1 Tax=Mycobacterium sp. TaxID=1785 RepID=UPI002D853726|nr:LysR substrate-binding domain-containing protein [Mycobacterium sp.]
MPACAGRRRRPRSAGRWPSFPRQLEAMTIISENLAALVPLGHRLVNRRRIAVDQLDGEPIVSMPVGTGIRAALDIGCAAAGFTPRHHDRG